MPSPDQGALPLPAAEGVLKKSGSQVADYYIQKIRSMLGCAPFDDGGRALWHMHMTEGDRRFVLRVGHQDPELARLDWPALDKDQRAAFVAAFMKLRDWVNSFPVPVLPYSANGRRS